MRFAFKQVGVVLAMAWSLAPFQVAAQAEAVAETPVATPAQDQETTVYLIREKKFVGGGRDVWVALNDKVVAAMDNGGHVVLKLKPGLNTLNGVQAKAGFAYTTVDDRPGETVYLLMEYLGGKITEVAAEQGLTLVKETKPQQVLAENGLKKGDYGVIVAGLTPAKYAALQTGSIAVAVLYQPTAQLALQQGLPDLYRFTKLKPAYPPSYYAINQKWAAEKDRGKRISRVIARAQAWLWDPKNRDEAIKILQKYTKRDAALLGQIYDQYFVKDKLYSPDGKVRVDGVQTIIDAMVERGDLKKGQLKPEDVILPEAIGGMIAR